MKKKRTRRLALDKLTIKPISTLALDTVNGGATSGGMSYCNCTKKHCGW